MFDIFYFVQVTVMLASSVVTSFVGLSFSGCEHVLRSSVS
jgi:hypothetical protein